MPSEVTGGRVCITCDFDVGGSLKRIDLPFVVGVLADLSGQRNEPLRPLKERKAVFIDRDNFNDVLARAAPRLGLQVANVNFEELTDGDNQDEFLWMSAAWAYAACVTAAFAKHGWFARTRGVEGGGKAEGLPVHSFLADDGDVAPNCPTEIAISERREFELCNLGFLPLLHNRDTGTGVFCGAQTCRKPQQYFDSAANAHAELSAKLKLRLCACRFVHCLKVMTLGRPGAWMESGAGERWLNGWLSTYVADPAPATEAIRSHHPLSDARVEVRPVTDRPGCYELEIYLRPAYQLETLTTDLHLVARLPKRP
jgi:type VI secretion system protein ImpC